MTGRDRDADEWADAIEIDPEEIAFEGEPEEALAYIEARIEELEAALDALDVTDPQRGPVHLELGTLRASREALRERLDVVDEEGSR